MRLLCLIQLVSLLAETLAQDNERPFKFPLGNETIIMGEPMTIKLDPQWKDDHVLLFTASKILLNLFIKGTAGGEPELKLPITEDPILNNGSYIWNPSTDYFPGDNYQIMIDNYRQNSAVYSAAFSLVKTSNQSDTAGPGPKPTDVAISSSASPNGSTSPSASSTSAISRLIPSSATGETSSMGITSSPAPTPVTSNISSEPTSSKNLPTGAEAGIAIGVAVFVLTISAFAFLLWRRQRKRWTQAQMGTSLGAAHDRSKSTNGESTTTDPISTLPELINIRK